MLLSKRYKLIFYARKPYFKDTETVTDDLELKEQDKIRLEKYDAAKDKLLTCLRSLEMELELNTLYHQYEEIRLKETVKAAKAK